MKRAFLATGLGLSVSLLSGAAAAHVSITSGPGFADTTQEVTFGVGHGCEGLDTYSVSIDIPPEITALRALGSSLGSASVVTDEAGLVTQVSWTKPEVSEDVRDVSYYKLTVRLRVPNAAFSSLYFPAHQVCRDAEGNLTTVDWIGTDPEATDVEPAPVLTIVPKRFAGWNKFTVGEHIHGAGFETFFSDALIVWKGDAAYSINPLTAALISDTPDVSVLEEIEEGDEIWVKY